MKNRGLILSLCFLASISVFSQEYSLKYGKVSDDELKMTVYQKDTTAAAVVIYDDGYTAYDIVNDRFQLYTDYKKKIKILKQEGVDEANITIPYYYKNSLEREMISGIEATVYNIEAGKVVKTKLERKYIFDEELSNRYRRTKFSVPGVKVGSVVEIKFRKSTGLVYSIDPWGIQGDIPVILSTYEVKIPEYFQYNIETKGYENIQVVETPDNQQFSIGNSSSGPNIVTCTSRNIKFKAKDVPALKDENYVWCVNDYLSAVRFELKATNFPYEFYKPYSQTWENLEKTLRDDTDFGLNMKMQNPFKDETKELLASVTDEKEKIEKIYNYIKSRISWNEKYSFMGNQYKDAIKDKTGNNGQINMVLLSMLKDAKIKAYPVLISRRSTGRLPYTFPSLDQLNTFVVAAETADAKVYYMDGSAIHGGLNMLPVDLMVDRARIFDDGHTEKWANLTNISKNQEIFIINSQLDAEGNMKGTLNTAYSFQNAYAYKQKYQAAKDSTEFIEKIQELNHITIDNFKVIGKEPMSTVVKEEIGFTKNYEIAGGYIYLNPMIFAHMTENKFTQTDRKLPIEFSYPTSYLINCNITLPENYQVVEIPKSVKIVLNENCKCIYYVQQEGNKVSLSYRFDMNQTIFPFTDYNAIKEFYGQLVTKNQEMVVLKKI